MSLRCFQLRASYRLAACLAIVTTVGVTWISPSTSHAQVAVQAIGGVRIDAEGVLTNLTVDESSRLSKIRQQALTEVAGNLNACADLRFVSLGRLAKTVAECRAAGKPLPDDVRYMAGLQRVRYVLVLPELNDLVLAGPAEGWKADAIGNVVGATTNRPVVLLDDLIVALRTYGNLGATASCSIDPTSEGLQRLKVVARQLRANDTPDAVAVRVKEALGPQTITIRGVDASSHFARVMITADFRMKRLAMKFEPSPVNGLPSYLDMIRAGRTGMSNMLPRWWLAPKYDALQTDDKKLIWELRGQGVQCLAEEDLVGEDGRRTHTGKAGLAAQRWADTMTEKFSELADHDSTFGQVRNLMDLAVVAAIISHERLENRAGVELTELVDSGLSGRFHAPRQVATQVSFVKKSGRRMLSASGGVDVSPWKVLAVTESQPGLAAIRAKAVPNSNNWWWQ